MKIGDKVYCIKNIIGNDMGGNYLYASKGNYYTIGDIYDSGTYAAIIYLNNKSIYLSLTEIKPEYDFCDYFITISELRKIKLDKLNDKSN